MSPADKASIHGPLLAEGPAGGLLFLPLSMRWMRGGTQEEGESVQAPVTCWIKSCISTMNTWCPEHLNTHAEEMRRPLRMMTKLDLSQSLMGAGSALHTRGGEQTRMHICTRAAQRPRSCTKEQRDDSILCRRQEA